MIQLTKRLVISRKGEVLSRELVSVTDVDFKQIAKDIHTYAVNRMMEDLREKSISERGA